MEELLHHSSLNQLLVSISSWRIMLEGGKEREENEERFKQEEEATAVIQRGGSKLGRGYRLPQSLTNRRCSGMRRRIP